MIKGLIAHTDLNDQSIQAIFSYLSRNINHREIAFIRDSENRKYRGFDTASKPVIEGLLRQYAKVEFEAKIAGVLPSDEVHRKLQNALAAMRCAVAIFNNPTIGWKSEIFIVNAIIAWTYLFHAYFQKNDIVYVYEQDGVFLLAPDGQPKLWDLSKCISVPSSPLPTEVTANLKYLIAIRHAIEHRSNENIDRFVESKIQACALNFERTLVEHFGNEYSIANELAFAIQFSEITLESRRNQVGAQGLPTAIRIANAAVENNLTSGEYNDPRYSYRVYIAPKSVNNRNNADQAVQYAPAGSAIEMAIRQVERPKYTASQIVSLMQQEGHTAFSMHKKGDFVDIWKSLDGKNPNHQFGADIAGNWYWYEKMVDSVRAILNEREVQ